MNYKSVIVALTASSIFFSCDKETKKENFVTLSGKIEHQNSDKLTISQNETGYSKTISVNKDGSFKDTLHIKSDFYTLFDGTEYARLFLEKGDRIHLTLDTKAFDETLNFTGEGAEESNFLAVSGLAEEAFLENNDNFKTKEGFDKALNQLRDDFKKRLNNKKFNDNFITSQEANFKGVESYANKIFKDKNYISNNLSKGQLAPKFSGYENFNGGTTSLDDLKGRYVYIDIWATWCVPCKQEIPYLQKVEKQFHDKNITFVSISLDEMRSYDTWKNFVKNENLTGVQLFSNRDPKLTSAYRISSIPRFILIDPKGKIVNVNAPRPSEPELIDLFNSLNI